MTNSNGSLRAVTVDRSALWGVGTLLVALSFPVGAQSRKERDDVDIRNACRLAVQTLATGHPAPKTDWALRTISVCDESAGEALEVIWGNPPADSAAIAQLLAASVVVRDGRISGAAMSAAGRTSVSQTARLSALIAIAAFLDPTHGIRVSSLRPNPDSTSVALMSHSISQITGSVALPLTMREDFRVLLNSLAESDPDATLRFAARRLLREFY